jgi:L-fuconolactonase
LNTVRVDSHQHFWQLARGDYGWLTPAFAPLYRDFGPGDLAPMLERNGIARTVLVQAAPTLAETHYLLELASRHDFLAAVVGWVDFEAPDASACIDTLAAAAKLAGLRPMVQDLADDSWLLRPSLAPALAAMQRHGLVFDALVKPRHLPVLREFLARYPGLKVVIDHGAKPGFGAGDLEPWARAMRVIARETSARCKLSGLVTEAGTSEPAVLAPMVDVLLEAFGPERLMWGSDWPVCELVCDYDAWLASSERILGRLSADERALIYGGVARETYSLDVRKRGGSQ